MYIRVNRAVLLAHVGEPPTPEHHAAHRNGDRTDNRVSNLDWLTPKENSKDQLEHGTRVRGERVAHLARLTDDLARSIWTDPRTIREIAEDHKITYWQVWSLKNGNSRRYLEDEIGPVVPPARGHRKSRRRPGGYRGDPIYSRKIEPLSKRSK